MRAWDQLKKVLILLFAVTTVSIVSIKNLYAQNDQEIVRLLTLIEQHTNDILTRVNNLPDYLQKITLTAQSWLSPDDSTTTGQMQQSFTSLGKEIVKTLDPASKVALFRQLTADLYGVPVSALPAEGSTSNQQPDIFKTLPPDLININDITYSTLVGKPPVPKNASATSPYNYIKFLSGTRLRHAIPQKTWLGDIDSQVNYLIYFAMVKSIESFNGGVLSDALSQPTFNSLQVDLINKATDTTWLQKVASDDLGRIFRQLLLFESQSYVLMSQSLQIQKNILAAITMSNSLLILTNSANEGLLTSKAKGQQPKP